MLLHVLDYLTRCRNSISAYLTLPMELLFYTCGTVAVTGFCGVSVFLASETKPPMAPRFMVSRAELGTITIEPFSLSPSNNIFIPLRWSATGLSVYFRLAYANFSAISVSAVPKMTRALRSRSACASLLIASAKSFGMAISLIPTV